MNRFRIDPAGEHFWVCDGGRRILLIARLPHGGFVMNLLFLRQPGCEPPELPESCHSATAMGLQADIRWRWGGDWHPMTVGRTDLSGEAAGVQFERASRSGEDRQEISVVLSRRDDLVGGYQVSCRSVLVAAAPAATRIEFLNLLPENAANPWPGEKRFRATVHEVAPGRHERRPHSQLTVLEQYFWSDADRYRREGVAEPAWAEVQNRAHRTRGSAAPYAISHLMKPMATGGVLFFTGEEVVPAVRVRWANAPLEVETCDVWYDEHLCLLHGMPAPGNRRRYEVDYEIFAMHPADAARRADEADTTEWSRWTRNTEYPAFFAGRNNAFVTAAAREYAGEAGVFFAPEEPREVVSWHRPATGPGAIVLNTLASLEPPSGRYYQSMRYDLAARRPWVEAFPLGFPLVIPRGAGVEFSATIRAEGEAEAWIELREAFWGRFHREHGAESQGHVVRSASVAGGRTAVVGGALTARIPGGLAMIFLEIAGRGRAWFTDLVVRRRDE